MAQRLDTVADHITSEEKAHTTHNAKRLIELWKNKAICFPTEKKLKKSLDWSILLYGCENWS